MPECAIATAWGTSVDVAISPVVAKGRIPVDVIDLLVSRSDISMVDVCCTDFGFNALTAPAVARTEVTDSPALRARPPLLPASYYGTVTVYGKDAPVGRWV